MYRLLILLIIFSCSSAAQKYPSHWWNEIPKDQISWWEIAPNSVSSESHQVVLSKRNELGILSNFAHTPFFFKGVKYNTVEGLWQSMKFPENEKDRRYPLKKLKFERNKVAKMEGFKAKEAGDYASKLMHKNKINWVSFMGKKMTYKTDKKEEHYQLIREIMLEKLKQNPEVKKVLMSTGDLILLPDHHTKKSDPPAWKYYQIWMEIRDEFR